MIRRRFPGLRLILTGADLRDPALPWANDLHVQLLFDMGAPANAPRNLVGVDFSGARLDGAILRGTLLCDASFSRVVSLWNDRLRVEREPARRSRT